MPVFLPPISRRRFLAGSVSAAAGLALAASRGWAAVEAQATDPHRFALISDTHVAADRASVQRGVNMADNFRHACADVLAVTTGAGAPRHAAAIVSGDLACSDGQPGDYVTFLELIKPVRDAGVPAYLGLGNHDHRARFWEAAGEKADEPRAVEAKHVAVIESPRANWFLLDSLNRTELVSGILGEVQLRWLAGVLDGVEDKPAIVVVHHYPDRTDQGGLTDTAALMDLLLPRRHVKALVFGHSHAWEHREEEGMHLVNLPPTAYIFEEGRPSGWVDAKLATDGVKLTLRCLDEKHKQHGEVVDLRWRA